MTTKTTEPYPDSPGQYPAKPPTPPPDPGPAAAPGQDQPTPQGGTRGED